MDLVIQTSRAASLKGSPIWRRLSLARPRIPTVFTARKSAITASCIARKECQRACQVRMAFNHIVLSLGDLMRKGLVEG